MTAPFDVITMGRVGVDLYPMQAGVPLTRVETFGKFLGGSATNVAVAASRHGRRSAVITRTGRDPFGDYVRQALRGFGVDDRWVSAVDGLPTPVTFCEIFPPDDFPLYFYRYPKAPDLAIAPSEVDLDAVRAAGVFWLTGTGLSAEPSRAAHHAALAARADAPPHPGHPRTPITVFDLDYRPMFWPSRAAAHRAYQEVLRHVTVAVGNTDECLTAVGTADPRAAAAALLDLGVQLAVVKQGGDGVLARTRDEEVTAPPIAVDVVNGLGAGDAFGGALCHGLLAGWPLARVLAYANAAGAIVASRLACSTAMPYPAEVEDLLAGTSRAAAPTDTPARAVAWIREVRATRPEAVTAAAAERPRWEPPGPGSGQLLVIAADHPARGVLAVGDRPRAMADRGGLLERLLVALSRPGVHGVLGTADILEDLLLVGALAGKLVLGSMNRGGIPDSAFTLDDRFTGYDAAGIAAQGFDGGKMVLRIGPHDPATADTLHHCAQAVDALAARRLLALVEPFWTRPDATGGVRDDLSPDAVVRAVAVASGLGRTSAYTWLKVPAIPAMERVVEASTLPMLLLGGDPVGDPEKTYARWHKALRLPGVRGLVVGRALLYPPDDDVAAAVDAAAALLS